MYSQIETSENATELLLQTHYYKTSYDELKATYLSILNDIGHTVTSVNDDYCEICSEVPNMIVIAKIIMQDLKETSIDFSINATFAIGGKKKIKAFIDMILKKIEEKHEFKGVSLHK